MRRKKSKNKQIKVIPEYESAPDAEERLTKVFEFLLSEDAKSQKRKIKLTNELSINSKNQN